jgi:PEP-CTERM motif-containing protein
LSQKLPSIQLIALLIRLGSVLAHYNLFEDGRMPRHRDEMERADMTSGTLRNLLCATLASAAWAFGAPAHAIAYSVGFDPDFFTGIITIDVSPACLAPFPGTNDCAFDVTKVSFTDSVKTQWFDPAVPEIGIGQKITLDSLDNIVAILVNIGNLEPVGADNPCDGNHLSFALDGTVTFSCGGDSDRNGTGKVTSITRVPEPATYALLGLGLLGLAASRRRPRA